MMSVKLPDDCAKQWDILLLLLSAEEKKIDRTGDTEIDTMNYFCNNEGVRKILVQWLQQMRATYAKKISDSDTALKCDSVSLLWRQQGNDKYRVNNIEDSYHCYSKSVVYANQNGPMYPLALANRSAALLRMKKYKECLSDVELALDNGYPTEQRHKLLLRRADCLIELGQRDLARSAFTAACEHAATLDLSPTSAVEFDKHIKIMEKKLEVLIAVENNEEDELPECFLGENEDFTAASKAVELKRSESAGRWVVAREAMRRGDVLFSEEPYAWVTLPADRPVCEACCRAHINCLPCAECSRTMYCGVECRKRAQDAFHRWECVGAMSNLFPTIGIAHLALRVLLISASNGFPPPPPVIPPPTSAEGLFQAYASVDTIHIYRRDTPAFYRVFNLVTNFDKMSNTDYIQYALTATLLTLYLETFTSFFDYLPSRLPVCLPRGQQKLFAAGIILRSMGQLVCNGHAALSLATVEDGTGDSRTVSEREIRRATAIYPSAAMMNHSCDPNIINTFHNSRLIVRCGRELSVGAEVLNCYGPHRAREPTAHRRSRLRAQYLFNCNCTACNNNEKREFVSLFSAYACQSCKGPVTSNGRRVCCQQCRTPFEIERTLALIERANELADQAECASSTEARCEAARESLRLRQLACHRYHADLRDAADRLARLYADMGQFSKSVELIKQNIQSLEYQFGSFSVEVAHELRKLSDVMLERIISSPQNHDRRDWCLEAHKVIKKAIQLMELNYGSWEPLVKRLKEQEALVASQLDMSRTPDSNSIHHSLHYNLKI